MLNLINRQQKIKEKGFKIDLSDDTEDIYSTSYNTIDFSKIKVGVKTLEDATVVLGDIKKANARLSDKGNILKAINNKDFETMREASNFYQRISGIYSRLCRQMAYLYRYDWMVTPYINDNNTKLGDKALTEFNKVLFYFDNSEIKRLFGEIALKVFKNGCYYGYKIPSDARMSIQELPVKYCRTRYNINGHPAIEFDMRFFDDVYTDVGQRMKILDLFPNDFKKGYVLYKQGKLVPDFRGDSASWYLLDTNCAFKFNLNGEDFPPLVSVIPAIIDLDAAQELDRKKMAQQLLKIIIQKMPIDKNGDLVFDVDEARELHNNAVKMLSKAIGIDVLTTFADVEVADMADTSTTTSTDELEKVERTVYNESGTAQNLFNTDGSVALEKSILNDEASMQNLISQFESFLNEMLLPFNKNPKKICFRAQMLPTTIYNYKEMAKLYKEQTQLGYSKMLPQIALGQSQSSILANAFFENDILDLVHVFIPPLMSSTMNAEALGNIGSDKSVGRPEKEDDQKSDKTLRNIEAQS